MNTTVKAALPFVPIAGPILSALYDNIGGGGTKSEEAKAKQILEFLVELGNQNKEQFDRIAEDLKTNRQAIFDAINENKISITDLVSKSSAEILEKVGNVDRNLDSLLGALNIPIKSPPQTDISTKRP